MIRRLVPMVMAAGAAMALLSSPAGATPIEPNSDLSALACHNADTPTQTPGWVHGRGWGDCGQVVDVFLQRHRGVRGWVIEDAKWYRGPGSAIASFNCAGTGHYTYRTLVQWRDGQGPKSAISGEARFNC